MAIIKSEILIPDPHTDVQLLSRLFVLSQSVSVAPYVWGLAEKPFLSQISHGYELVAFFYVQIHTESLVMNV